MFEGARTQRFKLTFVILGVLVIVLVISFAYGTWARTEREKEQVPRLGIDEVVKALREFQRKTDQFPNDFMELEERGIWIPDFGPSKRTQTHLNYYYVYGKSNATTCTVWAMDRIDCNPTGDLLNMLGRTEQKMIDQRRDKR